MFYKILYINKKLIKKFCSRNMVLNNYKTNDIKNLSTKEFEFVSLDEEITWIQFKTSKVGLTDLRIDFSCTMWKEN